MMKSNTIYDARFGYVMLKQDNYIARDGINNMTYLVDGASKECIVAEPTFEFDETGNLVVDRGNGFYTLRDFLPAEIPEKFKSITISVSIEE